MNENRQCSVCHCNTTKRCSYCKMVYYCSIKCQKRDRNNHKERCNPWYTHKAYPNYHRRDIDDSWKLNSDSIDFSPRCGGAISNVNSLIIQMAIGNKLEMTCSLL